jgi:ribokinase
VKQKRIFVLGSANMDLVFALDRLPREGETLTGGDLALFPGGKGANQACAAARLGGLTIMVARVGEDPFAPRLLESLKHAGVDASRVRQSQRPTGCACIYVMPGGENSIVISPGANAALEPDAAVADLADIGPEDILLSQLEIPIDAVQAAFVHARARGATTILDPAPARLVPLELLEATDFITPNQTEASILLGEPDWNASTTDEASAVARRIAALGPRSAILKLGEQGCLFSDGREEIYIDAFPVDAVDTTAAGDVFNGAFAVGLAENMPIAKALRFANAAAAISVTRRGAQPSAPSRAEVEVMLQESNATRGRGCSS